MCVTIQGCRSAEAQDERKGQMSGKHHTDSRIPASQCPIDELSHCVLPGGARVAYAAHHDGRRGCGPRPIPRIWNNPEGGAGHGPKRDWRRTQSRVPARHTRKNRRKIRGSRLEDGRPDTLDYDGNRHGAAKKSSLAQRRVPSYGRSRPVRSARQLRPFCARKCATCTATRAALTTAGEIGSNAAPLGILCGACRTPRRRRPSWYGLPRAAWHPMWRLPHATASSSPGPGLLPLPWHCGWQMTVRDGLPKRLEGGGAGLHVMPQGTKACMPPPPFPGPLVSGNRTGYTVDPCIDGRRRMMKCGRHNDINVIGYAAESGTRAAVRGDDGRLPPLPAPVARLLFRRACGAHQAAAWDILVALPS